MPQQFYPHPALLPVLLALTKSGDNADKVLDDVIMLVQSTKEAMQAMRSSIETFQAGMMKMAPLGAPQPYSGPGGHKPAKPKNTSPPEPVKESSPVKETGEEERQ